MTDQIDTLARVVQAGERVLSEFPESDIRFVGGIPTDMMVADQSRFLPEERTLKTSLERIDSVRPNGTLRDLDVRVLDTDSQLRADIEAVMSESVGDVLKVRVSRACRPGERTGLVGRVVASNLIHHDGVHEHALGPFRARVPAAVMTRWSVVLPEDKGMLPIFNPRYHLTNYRVRSLGGMRPKDYHKISRLDETVRAIPELWMDEENAAFYDLDTMSATLESLQTMPLRDAYQAHGTAGVMSYLVHKVEQSPRLVNLSQRGAEQAILRTVA